VDGFKTFKYYTAIKLHFTDAKFNVFTNKGRVRGSVDRFNARNDRMLFERLGRQFSTDKECIQYIAANFMYGNPEVVYNPNEGLTNYQEYLRRKQSMTKIFQDDLHKIINTGARYDQDEFSGFKIPDVVQLLLAQKITIETVVILDTLDAIVDKLKQGNHISLLLADDLRRIEKSRGFVKFDSSKVMGPYLEFLEETHGQDIPSTIA
jgi:hypothetical protein